MISVQLFRPFSELRKRRDLLCLANESLHTVCLCIFRLDTIHAISIVTKHLYVCVRGDGGLSICSTCHSSDSSALCRSGSIIFLYLSRIAGLDN